MPNNNMKIKRGDRVVITAGKDKGTEGRVLVVDRKAKRVVVENANMVSRHMKPRGGEPGGIIKKEAPVHVSNVMYLHNGKPTRIGYQVETVEKNGKTKRVKKRIAKSTGEVID